MEHNVEGHDIDIEEMQEMPELHLLIELRGHETSETPYGTDDEHLKEWIEFLRHCGGFRVY